MSIELELHLEGQNADETEAALLDLQEWLRREPIPKIRIHRKAGTPLPEEMGGALETILVITIAVQASIPYAKPMCSQVINSVRHWKKMQKQDGTSISKITLDGIEEDEKEIKKQVDEWRKQINE